MDKEGVDSATSENDLSTEADDVSEAQDNSSNIIPVFGKSRKPNWTSHEIRALIEGYSRNRDIMRSRGVYRSTGERAVGNVQRQGVWEAITEDVNKSRPDYPRSGPYGYSCERTVKEVVKKWVNLVNRMKSELAIKRSNPSFELGATSRAVYTIVHTNEPLEYKEQEPSRDASVHSGEATVKVEIPETAILDDESNTSHNSMDVEEGEIQATDYSEIQKRFRPILPAPDRNSQVPSNLRSAILKRQSQLNGSHSDHYSDTYRNSDGPSSAKRSARDASVDLDNYNYINDPSIQNLSNLEHDVDELRESYRLNKEILELQKRKLELEIEKTIVEKERMEIEKEKCLLEKETKALEKEITRLRKEMFEMKVKKMRQLILDKQDAEPKERNVEENKGATDESDVPEEI